MALKYKCNLELTEDQKEADEDHGIFESETRSLVLSSDSQKFTFNYDHYYESEINYVLNSANKNIVALEGSYEKQDNKIVAQIIKGNQSYEDRVAKKTTKVDDIKGKLEFLQDGGVLKLQVVDLQVASELKQKDRILRVNQVFKKA